MTLARSLADVDVAGAELDEPADRSRLVLERGGRQVEVDRVLARLLSGTGQETGAEAGAIGRDEIDGTVGQSADVPTQRSRPEAGEAGRVLGIEGEGDELRRHPVGDPNSSLARAHPPRG
jgi:hypothetical protein